MSEKRRTGPEIPSLEPPSQYGCHLLLSDVRYVKQGPLETELVQPDPGSLRHPHEVSNGLSHQEGRVNAMNENPSYHT